jgi:hypothetical protein
MTRLGIGVGFCFSMVASFVCFSHADAQVYPQRGLYSQSTGLVTARFSDGVFRGSGVIARDPRLVYSCAHVLYADGVWATSYKFHRAYHSDSPPYSSDGVSPRGFRYFTNYAPYAAQYGDNSYDAFSVDFVVYYADPTGGSGSSDILRVWSIRGNRGITTSMPRIGSATRHPR